MLDRSGRLARRAVNGARCRVRLRPRRGLRFGAGGGSSSSSSFTSVRQASPEEVLANRSDWPLPLIAKPVDGSSSIGLVRVQDYDQLTTLPAQS